MAPIGLAITVQDIVHSGDLQKRGLGRSTAETRMGASVIVRSNGQRPSGKNARFRFKNRIMPSRSTVPLLTVPTLSPRGLLVGCVDPQPPKGAPCRIRN
jgi:hypothetical protein